MADSANVITITDSNFDQEVLKSTSPVVLDFWAEWCGPCKMIAPILDEIASEKNGAVKIGKVNVDNNQELSARFKVRAIPTLLFFKNGEVKEQVVGMTSKKDLISKIEALG
jgi:thioredoxin 1